LIEHLTTLAGKSERLIVGLMSGTSLDGVDAALVRVGNHGLETRIALQHFITFPYPDGLKETILEMSTPGRGCVDAICRLNVLIGEIFADAVDRLLKEAQVTAAAVDLIGSHGQTIQHLPDVVELFGHPVRATLQIGEPSVIAKRTGVVTIADFRPADLAVGGQGAPLVPYFDYLFFRSPTKNRALLNIGGIANMTILPCNGKLDDLVAFDTGPGNMVVDWLTQELLNQAYDDGGQTALRGTVSQPLLDRALEHAYFDMPPPKSTGREAFGATFAAEFLQNARALGLSTEDTIATATRLTMQTVWDCYQKHIRTAHEIDEWIVSGGGAKNRAMLSWLTQQAEPATVKRFDDFGFSADAKEAICFAVLANETLMGHANNAPSATGAAKPTIMGKICL